MATMRTALGVAALTLATALGSGTHAVRLRVAHLVVVAVLVWTLWAAKLTTELKAPAEMEQVITEDNQMLRQLAEKPNVKVYCIRYKV